MFKLVFLSFGIGWQEDVVVYPLSKNGSRGVLRLSPWEDPFWFRVELFWVPCRNQMEPRGVLPGTRGGCPMGTAEEPFWVLDSTFFSNNV